jgi:hypothetical protein
MVKTKEYALLITSSFRKGSCLVICSFSLFGYTVFSTAGGILPRTGPRISFLAPFFGSASEPSSPCQTHAAKNEYFFSIYYYSITL